MSAATPSPTLTLAGGTKWSSKDSSAASNRDHNPSPSPLITPPDSPSSHSPPEHLSESTLISISTTFFPGAQLNQSPPDLVLLSSDSVFFYAHSNVLLSSSHNNFSHHLPIPPPLSPLGSDSPLHPSSSSSQDPFDAPLLPLPETADVINIILHTIYCISCTQYSPTLPTLSAALYSLHHSYAVPLPTLLTPSHPLFFSILSHAPASPLQVYTLAAQYDLEALAISCSPHLLSFPLSSLTDEAAREMGGIYLRRLFFLHLGRGEALKRLLLPPPLPHAPTPQCSFAEQKKLTRAWALAVAYLAWDARPDMPGSTLESALAPLGEKLWCDACRESLQERVKELIVQWSVVKNHLTKFSHVTLPLITPLWFAPRAQRRRTAALIERMGDRIHTDYKRKKKKKGIF